jgi:hypothetical protein
VEKLVTGKMAKQQYIDQEAGMLKKKKDAQEKIHQILKTF